MSIVDIVMGHVSLFLVILTRISGMLLASPIFGSRNIPKVTKIGFSLLLSLIVLPLLASSTINIPQTLGSYAFLIIGELLFGLTIGFAISLIFYAVQMTGNLLDMKIGFGVVNVIDPQAGHQVPLIGNFKYILALLLFLLFDGHHILLTAVVNSFKVVPITQMEFKPAIAAMIVDMVSAIFAFGFQITVPVIAAIIITDMSLGILARTMPQMNVFVVGIPGKIIIGILLLTVTLPFFKNFLEVGLHGTFRDVYRLFNLFAR